jgi:thioredoxin-dependent peroxiredoxin
MPWRLALLLIVLLVAPAGARAQELAPGARAPEFNLAGSDSREYRLSDLVGKRGVVLAWFPKAFTAG